MAMTTRDPAARMLARSPTDAPGAAPPPHFEIFNRVNASQAYACAPVPPSG